jgi:hypothetical protein
LPQNQAQIVVPETFGLAGYLATAYTIVGKIQAAHPPYFAQHIEAYAAQAASIFGHEINPIVE